VKRIVLLAALLVLPACQAGRQTASRPLAGGPLAGARWPVGAVRAGMLLHDDGRDLWSYRLDGRRQLLWRHRSVEDAVAAASPDGRELAYLVRTRRRQFLYLLSPNGSVRLVDSVPILAGWLHDAVFLRTAGPDRAPLLYWSRMESRRKRDLNVIRVLGPHGSAPVHVALREGEYPLRLAAYPGSPVFTLALGRRVQPPPPALLLDWPELQRTPERFGELLPLRDLDNAHGVAWLSQTTFALLARGRLRLFDYGCVFAGSKVVYSGQGLDSFLIDEGQWPLVPIGRGRLLVMPQLPASARRDEAATLRANARPLHWAVLDLRAHRLAQTQLTFDEQGWVYVQPDRPFGKQGARRCAGFTQPPS